jgi:hypothetical protein
MPSDGGAGAYPNKFLLNGIRRTVPGSYAAICIPTFSPEQKFNGSLRNFFGSGGELHSDHASVGLLFQL